MINFWNDLFAWFRQKKNIVSPINVRQKYENFFADKKLTMDHEQRVCIDHFERLYLQLLKENNQSKIGLYLWGEVGTGKTLMMNVFYQAVEVKKIRLHHHQLFQMLMNDLHDHKHSKSPLESAIKQFAKTYRIACFDDLHLSDIADAKLWQGFFQCALRHRMLLVITSNTHPEKLLDTPGYREKIQPLLDMMQTHLEVVELNGGKDYRTLSANQALSHQAAHLPPNQLSEFYQYLTGQSVDLNKTEVLVVQNRSLRCISLCKRTICFSLKQLCGTQRSYRDYIEICQKFDVIIICCFEESDFKNPLVIQRFIWLVDLIYDQGKRFFIFSDQSPISLLQKYWENASKRTISRLKQLFG